MRKLVFLIVLAILLVVQVNAQRYTGNNFGGYAGVLGVQENPASFVNKNPRWDINVIGTGLAAYSEYGYFANESVLSLSGKRVITNGSDSIPSTFNPDNDALFIANQYTSPITGFMYHQTIHLPSVSFKIKENFALGLFCNIRMGADAMNAPTFFNYSNLKQITDFRPYTIGITNVNAMAWGEIGANIAYAHTLPNDHILSIGLNPKYLLGFEAMYVQNKSDYNFYRDRDTFIASDANVTVGFASGASRYDQSYKFGINGTGIGLDIGAEYLIPNNNEQSVSPHYMKFGVAVRDLGGITFNKNAERHDFVINRTEFGVVKQITNNRSSNYEVVKRLSAALFNDDSVKSLVGNEISMYLPTSINLSWDYNFKTDFFVNVFASRRMTTLQHQLSAQNVWMVSGRFERRWFEAGLSASLTEDKWFGVGSYIRLGLFTIGSDHVNALLFSQSELRGADIYFSLKIMPFGTLGMTKKRAVDIDDRKASDRYSQKWLDKVSDARYEIGNANTGKSSGGKFGCFKSKSW